MIDDRVTENMAVNRSEWKNRTHKINQNRQYKAFIYDDGDEGAWSGHWCWLKARR